MNQNRNNNRRRGRGNNRGGPGGGGGGPQGNRIDSRARGNAPQMLEKYRKLAHDASLNGDRVQTEYYLQFADHYFRVVADSRTQQNEPRPRRDDHQSSSDYNDGYDTDERDERDERDEAPQSQPAPGRSERDDDGRGGDGRGGDGRGGHDQGSRGTEGDEIDSSASDENPFTRDARASQPRGEGRSGPRGRGRPSEDAPAAEGARPVQADRASVQPNNREPRKRAVSNDDASFDPGLLPPSIPRDEEAAPRAKTRARRPARSPEDGGDETLEAVS